MSRIEKALEKALELRKTVQDIPGEKAPLPDKKDVSETFKMADVSVNPDLVHDHIICIKDPHSSIAIQYKRLRVKLLQDTLRDFHNTIMITSPEIGDGKTITAINLAVAIAQEIDHTALLVDADLQNPSVHKYLGIKPRYGLCDYLKGNVELSEIIIKTGIGKLAFVPAGSSSQISTELISSEMMRNLIQELKNRYRDRYIIFDSPPVLISADTISLSNYMDGVLLVVRADHTTPKTASLAISQMRGSTMLGVVFNSVPRELAKNLYPYYYNYQYARKADNED